MAFGLPCECSTTQPHGFFDANAVAGPLREAGCFGAVPKGIKGSEFCWNVGGKHFLWLSLLKHADTKNIVNPTSTWSTLIYCVLSQQIVQGRPSDALSIGNYPGHVKRTKLPTASSVSISGWWKSSIKWIKCCATLMPMIIVGSSDHLIIICQMSFALHLNLASISVCACVTTEDIPSHGYETMASSTIHKSYCTHVGKNWVL